MEGLRQPSVGSSDAVSAPRWHLVHHDLEAELQVTGDWIACETGVRSAMEVRRLVSDVSEATLRIGSCIPHLCGNHKESVGWIVDLDEGTEECVADVYSDIRINP